MNILKKKEIKKEDEIPKPVEAPKVEEPSFKIGMIATQTEEVIFNEETKEQYTDKSALCKIMNDIDEIKKFLSQ